MSLALALLSPSPARSAQTRSEELQARIGQETIRVLIYRPGSCAHVAGPLLLVFPGYERNADDYLKRSRRIARAACATVIVPDLDQERFPHARYQRAGVGDDDAIARDDACMGLFIERLVAWARERERRPQAPFLLFGHSAGAQMLSRVAAYCPPTGADRIVIANPSSHAAPSPSEPSPFGFASILDIAERESRLRSYLDKPITIYLGTEDTGNDRLDQSREARRQGRNRLERGQRVFELGQAIAEQRGWAFNWRLVLAPGVGHSSREMLQAPHMLDAIAGLSSDRPK